jgi:hypothetical protein
VAGRARSSRHDPQGKSRSRAVHPPHSWEFAAQEWLRSPTVSQTGCLAGTQTALETKNNSDIMLFRDAES